MYLAPVTLQKSKNSMARPYRKEKRKLGLKTTFELKPQGKRGRLRKRGIEMAEDAEAQWV